MHWIHKLFNTRVSQFELNYWNKLTFPRHSNLLTCNCILEKSICLYTGLDTFETDQTRWTSQTDYYATGCVSVLTEWQILDLNFIWFIYYREMRPWVPDGALMWTTVASCRSLFKPISPSKKYVFKREFLKASLNMMKYLKLPLVV